MKNKMFFCTTYQLNSIDYQYLELVRNSCACVHVVFNFPITSFSSPCEELCDYRMALRRNLFSRNSCWFRYVFDSQVQPNGSLMISQASEKDDGFYLCQIGNEVGSDSKTAKLTVFGTQSKVKNTGRPKQKCPMKQRFFF